jgi:hypothetical protein
MARHQQEISKVDSMIALKHRPLTFVTRALVLALGLFTGSGFAAPARPFQKPVIHHSFHEEGRATSGSLEELWNRSDIVIEGVVGANRPADFRRRSNHGVHRF